MAILRNVEAKRGYLLSGPEIVDIKLAFVTGEDPRPFLRTLTLRAGDTHTQVIEKLQALALNLENSDEI